MKGNQYRERSLDEAFEAQLNRVRARLGKQVRHYRQRLEHLGLGAVSVEVRGTHGGGPAQSDDRSPTSERALYGAW